MIMKNPPMIVSGTIETMPARMADKYVFSLSPARATAKRPFRVGAWLMM
jgi:hypothetical protein